MSSIRSARLATPFLAPLLLLGACATPPALAPRVDIAGGACAAQPALATARPVPLKDGDKSTVELGDDAACLEAGGARSAYAVFRLPDADAPYVVTVTSEPRGGTLFAPRLMVLDAAGAVRRELPRAAFMFHGMALQAGFRAQPADRYLVVASDPASVGQKASRLVASTQETMVPMGVAAYGYVHTGSEATHDLTFAHNGSVTVSAAPLPVVR
jgi:hypothetical protein